MPARIPLYDRAPQMDTSRVGRIDAVQFNPELIAGSGEAIAGGLNKVAGVASAIGERQQKASDAAHLTDASLAMQQEYSQFLDWQQQNPDETQHLPEWQRRMGTLEGKFGKVPLSPDARLKLTDDFGRFKIHGEINVKNQAIKQTAERAVSSFRTAELRGDKTYDYTPAFDAIQRNVEAGVWTPEQGEAEAARLDLKATDAAEKNILTQVDTALLNRQPEQAKELLRKGKEAGIFKPEVYSNHVATVQAKHEAALQADAVQALSLTNPAEAVRKLEAGEFERISPGDRAAMITNAQRIQASFATDAFQDIATRIELGQVKPGEKFEGPGMESLTPLMRDVLKAKNSEAGRKMALNNPATYEQAIAQISAYTPGNDPSGLGKAEMEAKLQATFDGPHLQELKDRLEKRVKGEDSDLDLAPVTALMGEWAEQGGLGEYKVPVKQNGQAVAKKKEGAYVLDDGAGWFNLGGWEKQDDTFEPVTQADPALKAKAGAKQSQIRQQMEKEMKAGKFKTQDEIQARFLELYQQAGGTVPAGSAIPLSAPNPLLPALDAPKTDLNAKLNKYGY